MEKEKTAVKKFTLPLNKKHTKALSIVVGVILFVAVILLTWLYTGSLSPAKEKVFAKVPLPVAIVDGRLITGPELYSRLNLAKKILSGSNQKDTTAEEFLNQLIDIKKVQVLAAKNDVAVSDEEIDKQYQATVNGHPSGNEEAFLKELKSKYNLNESTLKQEVLKQIVLQNNLSIWFNKQENLNQGSYNKARDIIKLLDSGSDFDEVARKYTEDYASRDFAGDNGFVDFDSMLPEFQTAVKDLVVGDTKLMASRFGLHIIRIKGIEEQSSETDSPSYNLQQIFVKPGDFDKWFKEQSQSIKVQKLI